jgi:hypothetical protein
VEPEAAECTELPRYSSLFCFSVMRTKGYENDLMKAQVYLGVGIFSCDDFLVLADDNVSLGITPWGEGGREVITKIFKKEPVWVSKDGTAANTLLFMKAWDVVVKDAQFQDHAWVVKVDPDAVLLPERLRQHVFAHTEEKGYIVNCNRFPDSGDFPMMYGPVETFSVRAIMAYATEGWKCATDLKWMPWGEDYYMTHCMDYLGVSRILDFNEMGDMNCNGAICTDGLASAYHPFKDISSWLRCYQDAVKSSPPIVERNTADWEANETNNSFTLPPPLAFETVENETGSEDSSENIGRAEAAERLKAAEEKELAKRAARPKGSFCCNWATEDGVDMCGTCHPFASDNWCARDSDHCKMCSKTWCDGEKGVPPTQPVRYLFD